MSRHWDLPKTTIKSSHSKRWRWTLADHMHCNVITSLCTHPPCSLHISAAPTNIHVVNRAIIKRMCERCVPCSFFSLTLSLRAWVRGYIYSWYSSTACSVFWCIMNIFSQQDNTIVHKLDSKLAEFLELKTDSSLLQCQKPSSMDSGYQPISFFWTK